MKHFVLFATESTTSTENLNTTELYCFSKHSAGGNLVGIKPDRFNGLSSIECQEKCQVNVECKYFMFIQNVCYLKKADAVHDIKPNSNSVWGPKYCHGIFS